MNYFKHSFGILSLMCVGTLLTTTAYVKGADVSQSSNNYVKSIQDKEGELAMYPFVKGSVGTDNAIGMKLSSNSVTLFSQDSKYSTAQEQKELTFDSTNFFSKYPNLQSIELNGIELTETKLENLQKFIPQKIRGLALCDCEVAEDDISRLADIINLRQKLISFSLSFPKCSAETAEKFLNISNVNKNIKYLGFTFGRVNDNGSKKIAELIKNSGDALKTLTLEIGYFEDEDNEEGLQAVIDAIQDLKNLERLEISFIELPESVSKKLFVALGKLKSLKNLKLFIGNHRDYDQVKLFENLELCRDSIAQMKELETLDISSMQLPESCMHLLGQAVESLSELRSINISDNKLDEKGAEIFANSFKSTKKLEVLIANNCELDAQIFAVLCRSLTNTSLKQGYFNNNSIGAGIKSIILSPMVSLVALDFSNNNLTYGNIVDFLKALKEPITLKCVNFSDPTLLEVSHVERTLRHDEIEQWKLKSSATVALLGL